MSHANTEALRAVLEDAWERRADLTPEMIARDVRPAVDAAITGLESGALALAKLGASLR